MRKPPPGDRPLLKCVYKDCGTWAHNTTRCPECKRPRTGKERKQ